MKLTLLVLLAYLTGTLMVMAWTVSLGVSLRRVPPRGWLAILAWPVTLPATLIRAWWLSRPRTLASWTFLRAQKESR